jgi:6-phosphogluconolactonase (cycloisomerase 2 family)
MVGYLRVTTLGRDEICVSRLVNGKLCFNTTADSAKPQKMGDRKNIFSFYVQSEFQDIVHLQVMQIQRRQELEDDEWWR